MNRKALAYALGVPIIPINHIEGHISANFIGNEIGAKPKLQNPNYKNNTPAAEILFPAVCLVVSGGHTQLILIEEARRPERRPTSRTAGQGWRGWPEARDGARLNYTILGETRDDAAGEAFDKVAKMLNLGYPGGPAIAAVATKFKIKNLKLKIEGLPRPMLNSGDFDFSFSGLKTAVLYRLRKLTPAQTKKLTPAIAAEFQQAVIDVLTAKTLAAAKKYNAKTIMLAGGVAANDALRENFKLKTFNLKLSFASPPKNFCTDNAAMIALAAWLKTKNPKDIRPISPKNLAAQANLRLGQSGKPDRRVI